MLLRNNGKMSLLMPEILFTNQKSIWIDATLATAAYRMRDVNTK